MIVVSPLLVLGLQKVLDIRRYLMLKWAIKVIVTDYVNSGFQ